MSKLTVTSNKHNDAAKRVREAYRASRNVRTPERLNLAVLEKARAAIKPGFAAFPPAWARPLAFAATLLLGVAVVYEMRGAGPLPPSLAPREAPRTAPVANGAGADGSFPATAASPRLQRQQGSALPESSSSPETGNQRFDNGDTAQPQLEDPAGIREQLRSSARDAGRRLEAAAATEEQRNFPGRTPPALAGQAAPPADGGAAEPGRCQHGETPSAAGWWQCIETLRLAGSKTAAEQELELLRAAYPGFVIPE